VLPGSAMGLTTTSELGFSGVRTTEMRWSPRWLLVHSWSERRGSTVRGAASGASASRKSDWDVIDEPARGRSGGEARAYPARRAPSHTTAVFRALAPCASQPTAQ
jgi:hypothetical protein